MRICFLLFLIGLMLHLFSYTIPSWLATLAVKFSTVSSITNTQISNTNEDATSTVFVDTQSIDECNYFSTTTYNEICLFQTIYKSSISNNQMIIYFYIEIKGSITKKSMRACDPPLILSNNLN